MVRRVTSALARVEAETRERGANEEAAKHADCCVDRDEMAALRAERDALAEFWAGAVELTMEPDGGDPDAETLLEYALDAGLIVSEPYDPAKHGADFNEWADEGDPIRVLSKLGARLERVGTRLVTARAAANALAPEPSSATPPNEPHPSVAEDR